MIHNKSFEVHYDKHHILYGKPSEKVIGILTVSPQNTLHFDNLLICAYELHFKN
jgi:hypothetical protein